MSRQGSLFLISTHPMAVSLSWTSSPRTKQMVRIRVMTCETAFINTIYKWSIHIWGIWQFSFLSLHFTLSFSPHASVLNVNSLSSVNFLNLCVSIIVIIIIAMPFPLHPFCIPPFRSVCAIDSSCSLSISLSLRPCLSLPWVPLRIFLSSSWIRSRQQTGRIKSP